jgi:Tol biopolymer transport system component
MVRLRASLVSLCCLGVLAAATPSSAQAPPTDRGIPAPVAGRPPDSDAPPGSAPHWLPHDMWVHLHWVPFDEARLQRLLHISRRGLWAWLRNDVQTLAQLGAKRGYGSPRRLAAALVAPRAKDVSPAMARELRARTLRVLVQGHLSQHLIFHSLHQEAGPEAAAKLFGVRDTAAFQRLRRLDLSPLRIGRTHGRTRAEMQRGLERELRAAAREGVAGGDTSPRQAQIVLQRQLRQVPRWLDEDHYNGPPQTTEGTLRYPFRASFASPTVAGDGSVVLFDAQQPAPPLAVRYGEVVLEGRDLRTGALLDPRDASTAALLDRPCSSYRPSLSSDGRRIAFETSAGNRTYAKRYGNVVVAVADAAAGTVRVVAGGYDGARVETAYDPTLSDDGSVVAYESVIADPMSPSPSWATRVRVRDLRARGETVAVPRAGAYEPELSGDGRVVAFTSFSRGRLQVFAYDRLSRTVTLVSRVGRRAERAAEAWEPSLSRDGRRIAFTATRVAGGRARVYVRDMGERTARAVSSVFRGFSHEPSISADGRHVVFAELPRHGGQSPSGRPAQSLLSRDLVTSQDSRVSAPSASWSGQPQTSDDGRTIAYTTDAGVAAGGGPGGLRVMVLDVDAGTSTTASPASPTGSFDTAPALRPQGGPLCSLAPPAW